MNIKIAYQGRPGAYSHLACIKAFPNAIAVACETFEEAFQKTHTKKTDISFIPVENSLAGRVADIHNLLPKTKLVITGEFFLKIDHQLLGVRNTNLENIKSAVSHFHALAQYRLSNIMHKCMIKCEFNANFDNGGVNNSFISVDARIPVTTRLLMGSNSGVSITNKLRPTVTPAFGIKVSPRYFLTT